MSVLFAQLLSGPVGAGEGIDPGVASLWAVPWRSSPGRRRSAARSAPSPVLAWWGYSAPPRPMKTTPRGR